MKASPKQREPREAAIALRRALGGHGATFTIADAAAKSGLPFRDAERGMHALLSEYRGHLRVTEEGELLFVFPHGFTKPWVARTRLQEAGERALRLAAGAGRVIVRAWVAIALLTYAVLFLALMIGLVFARSSGGGDSRSERGHDFGVSYILFRVVADAFFWTFHPFSPVAWSHRGSYAARGRPAKREGPPFYERVNRFFFGPERPREDPLARERAILAEIRAQKGRIGLSDVLRVTGLAREEADPLMARLMLDYDGTVEVSPEGGITYRFAELRKTAADRATVRPRPVWSQREALPPLTGNDPGTNLLIGALNGFNLIMSLFAISSGLTLERIGALVSGVPAEALPPPGLPIAFGVVPLVFSVALFALPLGRALLRPLEARRVARENGRRAVLRAVLEGVKRGGVTEDELRGAYASAAGVEPEAKALTREVVALGGDVDLEASAGAIRYRFPDLEIEARALEAEREAAAEEEAKVGPVIFTSEA